MDESYMKVETKINLDEDETITIRLPKKLREDYTQLCRRKGSDRSKRLRNFMIFELKKDAETRKTEAEQKPKDLNTGNVTTN